MTFTQIAFHRLGRLHTNGHSASLFSSSDEWELTDGTLEVGLFVSTDPTDGYDAPVDSEAASRQGKLTTTVTSNGYPLPLKFKDDLEEAVTQLVRKTTNRALSSLRSPAVRVTRSSGREASKPVQTNVGAHIEHTSGFELKAVLPSLGPIQQDDRKEYLGTIQVKCTPLSASFRKYIEEERQRDQLQGLEM